MTRTLKPPSHLGKHGRDLWRDIVQDYAISDGAGLTYVTTAAECLDRIRDAQVLIKKHGLVVDTGAGGMKPNPAVRVEHDGHGRMLAALRALNLDIEPLRDKPGRPPGVFHTANRRIQ